MDGTGSSNRTPYEIITCARQTDRPNGIERKAMKRAMPIRCGQRSQYLSSKTDENADEYQTKRLRLKPNETEKKSTQGGIGANVNQPNRTKDRCQKPRIDRAKMDGKASTGNTNVSMLPPAQNEIHVIIFIKASCSLNE